MNNGKKVIAILTDRTFVIRNVAVVMNYIHEIIVSNKDAVFIYGMNDRVDYHVVNFTRIYGTPKENLIEFNYSITTPTVIIKEFLSILTNNPSPDEIHIFTDYSNSDTGMLITTCRSKGIPTFTINSSNEISTNESVKSIEKYYKGKGSLV